MKESTDLHLIQTSGKKFRLLWLFFAWALITSIWNGSPFSFVTTTQAADTGGHSGGRGGEGHAGGHQGRGGQGIDHRGGHSDQGDEHEHEDDTHGDSHTDSHSDASTHVPGEKGRRGRNVMIPSTVGVFGGGFHGGSKRHVPNEIVENPLTFY